MPRTGLVPCLSIFYCEFAGAGDVGEGQSRALVIVGSDFEPWILQILGAILGCRYIVDESDTSIIQCAMKKKEGNAGLALIIMPSPFKACRRHLWEGRKFNWPNPGRASSRNAGTQREKGCG